MICPIFACRVVKTALGFGRVIYALLDGGSDRDVISQSVIKDLLIDTWTELTGNNDIPPAKRYLLEFPHLLSLEDEES